VIVTRDGSTVFLYTRTQEEAEQATSVVRELLRADDLTAELRTTRWHPAKEAWEDAAMPLPRSEAEEEREREQLEERERQEVAGGAEYDWHVHVRAPGGSEAERLEERLRAEAVPVERRWRYLTIGALTNEQADDLAGRIRDELPEAEIEIQPTLDLPDPLFVLIRSWL
jgi:hypothetical protein